MEQDSLEENTAECVQASKAHLPSLTSWRYPHSARAPTTVDALLVGQTPGSTQDHPGQSGSWCVHHDPDHVTYWVMWCFDLQRPLSQDQLVPCYLPYST